MFVKKHFMFIFGQYDYSYSILIPYILLSKIIMFEYEINLFRVIGICTCFRYIASIKKNLSEKINISKRRSHSSFQKIKSL